MTHYKVGIIGNGFVGESQAYAFAAVSDVRIFDINPLKATHTLNEVHDCDFVFVCVPTPMRSSGEQDLSYIESVFQNSKTGPIYIIKSTVLPGTTNELQTKYPDLNIVFNPEFLTERNAKLDVLNQSRIILGGDVHITKKVEELYSIRFMNKHFIHTDSSTAELIKYMNNTFLATKVSIMNEFYRLSNALGANWNDALHGFASDGRISESHLQVPGPDGKFGYGGTCFPKDVNAIINLANKLGVPMHTIEGGWKTNLEVRPEQDWNEMKGRAVSETQYDTY
jgi:UDPglucose 6-dehydrogenase